MISVTKYNTMTNVGHFYVDTKVELANLPNLVDSGKDNLSYMRTINVGSTADCFEDKKTYILTGSNEYKELYGSANDLDDIDFGSWSV